MIISLILFITFIISALFLNSNNQWCILISVFVIIFLFERRAFNILLKLKFLLFLAILLFGVPVFLGQRDMMFYGIPYSREYFRISVSMVNRSLIILLSLRMFTHRITTEQIASGIKRIGLNKFSDVLSISIGVLPDIKRIAVNTFRDFKESPRQKNIIVDAYHWTVKLFARILIFAQTYDPPKIEDSSK